VNIQSQKQLENTRKKLKEAEERYRRRKEETPKNPLVHELTLRSLKKTINQLTEEIVRYESHAKQQAAPGDA
jgi:hypothetical protein